MKTFSDALSCAPTVTESRLVMSVAEHLFEEGYRVRLEVSNMGQSIDVVATKNRWITAIEAKRRDWRRALQQCRAHVLVADYVAIALAQRSVPAELSQILHADGWGLLLYDSTQGEWRWEIRPRKNERVWQPQRRRFSDNMRKVGYAS
jgi:hypothetical protein